MYHVSATDTRYRVYCMYIFSKYHFFFRFKHKFAHIQCHSMRVSFHPLEYSYSSRRRKYEKDKYQPPASIFPKKKKDDKFKFLTGLKQVILKLLKLKTTKTSCTINLSVRKLFFYFLQKGTLSYHQTPFQYPSHKKALYFTITLQHLLQNSRNNFLIKDQICAGLYFFTNFTSAFQ